MQNVFKPTKGINYNKRFWKDGYLLLPKFFSLGEFGATWILVRSGSWDTLSILTDQLMNQPKFNPLIYPMAMASASLLMILTFILFLIAERVRTEGQGSGF